MHGSGCTADVPIVQEFCPTGNANDACVQADDNNDDDTDVATDQLQDQSSDQFQDQSSDQSPTSLPTNGKSLTWRQKRI